MELKYLLICSSIDMLDVKDCKKKKKKKEKRKKFAGSNLIRKCV